MEIDRATLKVGKGLLTVNVKLVVPPEGEPETWMVYVPVVAEAEADNVRVEAQVVLGEQAVGLNAAVTPVGKGPATWAADRVTAWAVPPVLETVMVLEPLDPLTAVILPLAERV